MAIQYTSEGKAATDLGSEHGKVIIVTWVLTVADYTGVPFVAPTFDDVTVQAYGSDWGGRTLNFRGTLETDAAPGNYINLTDTAQAVIALTEAGIKTVLPNVYQYSPLLSGAPVANVTVKAIFTKRGR
jgi:hypothetical protein